jgi:hypothetical protein
MNNNFFSIIYMKYLGKYLKYKGKYLEIKYGGYIKYEPIIIDNNDNEFITEAVELFNSEIGKYLKKYLDNLTLLIVSNYDNYQKTIDKNEQFLLTLKDIYNQFLSFIKDNNDKSNMKEFIKLVNNNMDFKKN